jgi:hypothetical protein
MNACEPEMLAFPDMLTRLLFLPHLSVAFARSSVDHDIMADWFVMLAFCTDEISGALLSTISWTCALDVRLNVAVSDTWLPFLALAVNME